MKKEYNQKTIFDNLEQDEKQEFFAFSLESYIRSAAQRMIQAALEMEVDEFLQLAKGEKSSQAEFRGYRNGGANGFDGSQWFGNVCAARFG